MPAERDPAYRGVEAWEYGEVQSIHLNAILSDISHIILWSYTFEDSSGGLTVGGFPGPFEALADALATLKERAKT